MSLSSGKASSWARLEAILSASLGYTRNGSKLGMECGGNEVAYIEFGSTNGGLAPGGRNSIKGRGLRGSVTIFWRRDERSL